VAILLAYLSVVLIWATTPLTIQWSSDSLSFMAAVVARMSLALGLALVIHGLLRQSLTTYIAHYKIYFAASLGIFPNMPVVYWAAQYIPSGLVAVIFALSPFVTGCMTMLFLQQNPFTLKRVLALLLAVIGLVVIFYQQMKFDADSIYGIAGIFVSCILFSISSVWVKKLTAQAQVNLDAFHQATGALLFSLPGLVLTWWWLDGAWPQTVSFKSASSVIYLAIMGSLVGAALFFYILQRLSANVVSLITLMTPVLAIMLGRWAAAETFSVQLLFGVGLVLLALLLYMPWSMKGISAEIGTWFENSLRTTSFPQAEDPQRGLQDIKDDVIRYK
jgi:drug/metabolite transporter (DMT)-like permease